MRTKGMLALVLGLVFFTSCLPEQQINAMLGKAALLIDQGQFEEAISILESPMLVMNPRAKRLLVSAYVGSAGVTLSDYLGFADQMLTGDYSNAWFLNQVVALLYKQNNIDWSLARMRTATALSLEVPSPILSLMAHSTYAAILLAKVSQDGVLTVEDVDQKYLTNEIAEQIIEAGLAALDALNRMKMSPDLRDLVDSVNHYVSGRDKTPRQLRRSLKYFLALG